MPKRMIALATLLVSVAILPSAFADSRFITEADAQSRSEQTLFNSIGQTAPKSVKPSPSGTVSVTNSMMDVGAPAANVVNVSAQQAMQASQLNQAKLADLEKKLASAGGGGSPTVTTKTETYQHKYLNYKCTKFDDYCRTFAFDWYTKTAQVVATYQDGKLVSRSLQSCNTKKDGSNGYVRASMQTQTMSERDAAYSTAKDKAGISSAYLQSNKAAYAGC